ncbi:MAG: DUF4198 domain-containing protein [Gemmatimonadaceae bacterium]
MTSMKRALPIAIALVLLISATLAAHDLFIKPASYYLEPNTPAHAYVVNGTFTRSENAITFDRVRDLSVVSPEGHAHPDTAAWSDKGDTSVLRFTTGGPGTYTLGVSTLPRVLRLEAKDFNAYLASDGVPDVLAARRRDGELAQPARERYHKHVKALVQVGGERSDHYTTALGYPAELVPLENPYSLRRRAVLRLRTLVDGQPAANQYVVAGGRTRTGARIPSVGLRSDAEGVVRVPLRSAGHWYVKFIHMTKVIGDSAVDYESKWASLTFEVRT